MQIWEARCGQGSGTAPGTGHREERRGGGSVRAGGHSVSEKVCAGTDGPAQWIVGELRVLRREESTSSDEEEREQQR